ncbi:MAG: hypothetical protein K2O08_05505, partial [Clostridia bacterium]|nr:hypothetical protein [Clostridia bacterium]
LEIFLSAANRVFSCFYRIGVGDKTLFGFARLRIYLILIKYYKGKSGQSFDRPLSQHLYNLL